MAAEVAALARHRRAVGLLESGERNSITDVPGVRVGHSQSESGEPTGVTVVAPPALPAPAGTAVVNGMGELTGKIEIDERGTMETPVYLCGTHAVGIVHHAAVLASGRGPGNFVLPVVGECDDSWRADSRRVTTGDVERALEALGIGRRRGHRRGGHRDDVLRLPRRDRHRLAGGRRPPRRRAAALQLRRSRTPRPARDAGSIRLRSAVAPAGSCISVCATDAPVGPQRLRRLALRALLGLVRVGSYGHDGSGEIGLAFGTTDRAELSGDELDPYFAAAWEAAQESVYNCLIAARPAQLRDGTMQEPFPIELVRELARARDARR